MRSSGDIAIVGMAGLFPGAPDATTFWSNICAGVDAIRDMPASGWDPVFYDPTSTRIDRIRCRRGGFIDDAAATFPAARFGVMPLAAKGAEPDQLLVLSHAARAFEDAGYDEGRRVPRNSGVILGRGNLAGAGRVRYEQLVRGAEQVVQALAAFVPAAAADELERVRSEFRAQLGSIDPAAVIGLVPNLLASRVASYFDLTGPSYTIDAACASALVALDQACLELQCERVDLMLCGAVHICRDEAFWSVFNQLGALSASGCIRPFDQRADGLLIGEGLGLFVLKRLEDALADRDRIYAVVKGIGVSSDGRGQSLVSPSSPGQVLALERAWQRAQREPRDLGLLEAHGTGTPTGDAAEIETLRTFFGEANGRRVPMGAVKSMIGHTMPAAGAAGLMKTVFALHHAVVPPSLHCEQPRPELDGTAFRLIGQRQRWPDGHRMAAVSAFGFGGINAHAVLEAAPSSAPRRALRTVAPSSRSLPEPALFAAADVQTLLSDLRHGRRGTNGRARLAVLDPSPERLAQAARIVERGAPTRGRLGIMFSPDGLLAAGSKLAFLFPGFDAEFAPRVEGLERFGCGEPPAFDEIGSLESQGLAIFRFNTFIASILESAGIRPHVVAGHSVGDWSALVAGGLLSREQLEALSHTLRPGTVNEVDAIFVAAGCSAEKVRELFVDDDSVVLSHDNCPHQVILCTSRPAADVLGRFASRGLLAQQLPFGSGVHTPYFQAQLATHAARIHKLEILRATIPVYSATTCAPYPPEPEAVRSIILDHMVSPVRFRELVLRLFEDGVRVFVQVGTGSLASFVSDTLKDVPHLALAANVKSYSGAEQLQRALCALWVEGQEVRWPGASDGRPARREQTEIPLALGLPLVRIAPRARGPAEAPAAIQPAAAVAPSDRVLSAFELTMRQLASVQREIVEVAAAGPRAPSLPKSARVVRRFDLQRFPELLDHSFYKQPIGWGDPRDLMPVFPMTGLMLEFAAVAEQLQPGRRCIGLEDVRALRWVDVADGLQLECACNSESPDRLQLKLGGYASATACMADRYPAAPVAAPWSPIQAAPAPFEASEMYSRGFLFHGPRYRGVKQLGPMGKNGICGRIESLPAIGALLDSAAQVFGIWVQLTNDRDRLAMPTYAGKVSFYGPHPVVGSELQCEAELVAIDARSARGKLRLIQNGHVWASIEPWELRRFPTDERIWRVMLNPAAESMSDEVEPGVVEFRDVYTEALARDYLAGRYLMHRERERLGRVPPRERRAWLGRRVASKDAARSLHRARTRGHCFPVEVALEEREADVLLATIERAEYLVRTAITGDTVAARAVPKHAVHHVTAASAAREANLE